MHLYSDRGPISVGLTVVKLGIAVAGIVVIGREVLAGQVTQVFWTGLVMAAAAGCSAWRTSGNCWTAGRR